MDKLDTLDTQGHPAASLLPEAWPWEAQAMSLGAGTLAQWPAPGQPSVAATYWRMLRGASKPAWVDPEAAQWPRLDMATPPLAMSPGWLARYRQRVMDERAGPELAPAPAPVCWPLAPFVLASRWQMAMLAHPQAPLRVLGAVHTGLQLRQWRPAQAGESLRWRLVSVPGVRHARGVEHGLLVLWHDESGLPVGHALSTYLLPQPREGGGPGSGQAEGSLLGLAERQHPELSPQGQAWPLPVDYGRRYAPVSLDFNPIHLWAWSARWLGFRQPIAHGMALAARALADASTRMPGLAQGAGRLSLRWLKPCLLPRALTAWCGQDERGGLHGELRSDGQTPHLRWHWQPEEGIGG